MKSFIILWCVLLAIVGCAQTQEQTAATTNKIIQIDPVPPVPYSPKYKAIMFQSIADFVFNSSIGENRNLCMEKGAEFARIGVHADRSTTFICTKSQVKELALKEAVVTLTFCDDKLCDIIIFPDYTVENANLINKRLRAAYGEPKIQEGLLEKYREGFNDVDRTCYLGEDKTNKNYLYESWIFDETSLGRIWLRYNCDKSDKAKLLVGFQNNEGVKKQLIRAALTKSK